MNPPDKALVLCVDEKSQIQALDRTQPGLPMKKGRAATMTHDYKRNGTTTLFAALNVKTGEVLGECLPRHRAKEFIRFLKKIDRTVAKHLDLHLIVDNYTTHKTKEVQAWLERHPCFKLHFIPTSSSWLNLVERFFAEITGKRIRRGSSRLRAYLVTTEEPRMRALIREAANCLYSITAVAAAKGWAPAGAKAVRWLKAGRTELQAGRRAAHPAR